MNKSVVTFLIVCGVLVGTAGQAAAQGAPWSDRGYINVGWGVESGSSTMTDTKSFPIYDETGTITSSSTFTSGSLFDVGVGLRIWKNLTVGGGYHQEQNTADGTLTASVPSPVFFNRPRTVNATVEGLTRKESAVHVMLGWVIPFSSKFDVMLTAGPSFFRLEQEAVNNFLPVAEAGGAFTSVSLTPTRIARKKSQTGYNAGLDATYILWSNDSIRIGAGGFVRFTQASTEVEMLNSSQPTDVGGVQFGFGGRIRF